MRLESVQELRLSLLRHWTLLDAMRNSPYVATRLGLWSKKGTDNLKTWLCRMGIPLDEGGQTYAYMKPETRQKLHETVRERDAAIASPPSLLTRARPHT
jgi:cell division control protein 45